MRRENFWPLSSQAMESVRKCNLAEMSFSGHNRVTRRLSEDSASTELHSKNPFAIIQDSLTQAGSEESTCKRNYCWQSWNCYAEFPQCRFICFVDPSLRPKSGLAQDDKIWSDWNTAFNWTSPSSSQSHSVFFRGLCVLWTIHTSQQRPFLVFAESLGAFPRTLRVLKFTHSSVQESWVWTASIKGSKGGV